MELNKLDNQFSFSLIQDLLRCNNCFKEKVSFSENKLTCNVCKKEYQLREGILDFFPDTNSLTLAQKVNHYRVTSYLYEKIWRKQALTVLSHSKFSPASELHVLFDYLNVEKGGIFLDIGCSTGFYSRAVANQLKETGTKGFVIALDICENMLRQAQAYARAENLEDRILFIRANAENLPFRPYSLDKIMCGGSMNEYQNPPGVLKETRRIITRRGRFYVMNALKGKQLGSLIIQKGMAGTGLKFYDVKDYYAMFHKAGFRVSEGFIKNILMMSLLRPV